MKRKIWDNFITPKLKLFFKNKSYDTKLHTYTENRGNKKEA